MSTEPTPAPTDAAGRLRSIDALRGFDMFWIIGGDALFRALAKTIVVPDVVEKVSDRLNWPEAGERLNEASALIQHQLDHARWEGFRFYDLIFPLFLFLVGVVLPFSLGAARQRGADTRALVFKILRRTLLLFLLALLYNDALQLKWLYDGGHWRYDLSPLRVLGVLQRIAICYGVAALIVLFTNVRTQAVAAAVILLGYWAIMALVPAPADDVSYLPPGHIASELTDPRYRPETNLSAYLDRHYLPGKILRDFYGYGDNEGLLSTLPAVATALLGALAGQWLRTARAAGVKVLGLLAAGLVCLAAGWVWGQWFPIIKNLWTSSFVLFAGGWSLLLLALFYGVIDGLGWKAWAFFFVVIGANAITIYVGQRFLGFDRIAAFFFGGLSYVSGVWAPVVTLASVLAVKWLFLYVLYRNRWFLRV
jgi:predicted acyltransferase